MYYCHIYRLGSVMKDFLCSVKIRESILVSYCTRYLQRLVKFCQRRIKWEVDSASKLRQQCGFSMSWKYCLNVCSLRRVKEVGSKEVYTNLFETSSVWQVFKVGVSSVPWDSLEVKKIIKVKFLWIIAATAGCFYDWVSVSLEKHPRDVFCGTLSLVAVLQWRFMFILVETMTISFVI